MFDLGVVDLSRCIQSADFAGCELCIWTQLQSSGLFCLRAWLVFTLASHLGFPRFCLHPRRPLWEESDPLHVSPVLLRLLSGGERTLAGWQLAPRLSPVISSRLLYGVSLPPWQPVWTLTGYFGLKFQHPSVKPNKHYLKGQQKPPRQTEITSGQLLLCLFVDLCGNTWRDCGLCVWIFMWLWFVP